MQNISKIGFGAYRISIKSEEHKQALIHALNSGCNLIDTSSNYCDGESEELIGQVLAENSQFNPIIITKAGYIQGKNLAIIDELNSNGKAEEDLVEISENLKHSIHPDFLEDQINRSLYRLQKESIDVFLLHNPEYYFKVDGSTHEQYYERIEKAFKFLEEKIEQGKIKSYGISSNTFPKQLNAPDVTNLEKVYEIAQTIKKDHNFKFIQFPLNLIENYAMNEIYGKKNLIEKAKEYNLTTLINRPLNAFTDDGLVRLANYKNLIPFVEIEKARDHFHYCLKLVEDKYLEQLSINDPEKEKKERQNFYNTPIVKQVSEIWETLPSPDAVEQVFYAHLFPFIAQVWGENGVPPEESTPFYKLVVLAMNLSRQQMSLKADITKKILIEEKILEDSDKELSILAIEKYLEWGADHILLGMKNEKYVDQVDEFL